MCASRIYIYIYIYITLCPLTLPSPLWRLLRGRAVRVRVSDVVQTVLHINTHQCLKHFKSRAWGIVEQLLQQDIQLLSRFTCHEWHNITITCLSTQGRTRQPCATNPTTRPMFTDILLFTFLMFTEDEVDWLILPLFDQIPFFKWRWRLFG